MDYMRRQMRSYQDGTRRDDLMANWGGRVSDDELTTILEYLSSL